MAAKGWMLALAVTNRELIRVSALFLVTMSFSGTVRHWSGSTLSSISVKLSQLPCHGIARISIMSARRLASAGGEPPQSGA
jgi:hypothetical protein